MKPGKIPFRFWIAVMVFYSTFVNYTMRVNMSVSILAMKKTSGKAKVIPVCLKKDGDLTMEETLGNLTTPSTAIPDEDDNAFFKKMEFSNTAHGQLMSAYGYGYIVFSIPGGFLSEYFGPKRTLFYSNLVSVILTALCPFAALIHWTAVFVLRVLIGAMGGVVYPAVQILISRWAPPHEKGKFVSALMGNTLGTALTLVLVGLVTDLSNYAWGFFFVSIFSFIYCIVVLVVVSDNPQKSKFTSQEEKDYLAEHVPPPRGKVKKSIESTEVTPEEQPLVPPYKEIFTSVRFWALCACHFANLYGLFIIILSTPQYFAKYLGFDLKKSGAFSACPPLVRLFSGILFGILGDYVIKKQPCSKTAIRKIFLIFSHYLPGVCLLLIMFCGCNYIAATACLTLCQGFNAAAVLTNLQNPQDLAPNFSGTIFGIMSTIGGITQFIVPPITAAFTAKGETLENWQWVFIIGGSIYFFGATMFAIFGSAVQQPWNVPKDKQPAPVKV